MKYQDYYQVLGVPRNADAQSIKSAFRKLARQHHPDANKNDPGAESRFKTINEAYTVLSDPEKRRKYDRFGKDWEKFERAGGQAQDFDWSQWGAGGPRRRMSPDEFEHMFGGQGMGGQGFSTFFEQLFGTGSMGGFAAEAAPRPKPPQRTVKTELTLDEAYAGTTRTVRMANGKTVQATIPPGVATDSRIRLRGSGGETESDIYLKIEVQPHPHFTRNDDDLQVRVPVDLFTAVLGGEVPVPTMEGMVQLKIRPGTQSHTRIALSGKGMPNLKQPSQKGKLIALIDVRIPERLSRQQKKLFEELRNRYKE